MQPKKCRKNPVALFSLDPVAVGLIGYAVSRKWRYQGLRPPHELTCRPIKTCTYAHIPVPAHRATPRIRYPTSHVQLFVTVMEISWTIGDWFESGVWFKLSRCNAMDRTHNQLLLTRISNIMG